MCTVSYIPLSESTYILTQNRDVGPNRAIALPPELLIYKGVELQYPIDPEGGGTWNAVSDTHQAFLLNGADYDYFPDFNAPKSRGSLCLDMLVQGEGFMEKEDLSQYDDFTLLYITLDRSQDIEEFRWNGSSLVRKKRDGTRPQMWISRGLYSYPDYQRKRKHFDDFLTEKDFIDPGIMAEEMWKYHHQKRVAAKEGFLIDRPGLVRTVSVLQTIYQDSHLDIRYEDH